MFKYTTLDVDHEAHPLSGPPWPPQVGPWANSQVVQYFHFKLSQWEASAPSCWHYAVAHQRQGLMVEFSNDNTFRNIVCPFIHQAGQPQLRSQLLLAAEGFLGREAGFPVDLALDIILGAAADVCGYRGEAQQLENRAAQAAAVAAAGVGLALLLAYLFSRRD